MSYHDITKYRLIWRQTTKHKKKYWKFLRMKWGRIVFMIIHTSSTFSSHVPVVCGICWKPITIHIFNRRMKAHIHVSLTSCSTPYPQRQMDIRDYDQNWQTRWLRKPNIFVFNSFKGLLHYSIWLPFILFWNFNLYQYLIYIISWRRITDEGSIHKTQVGSILFN